LPVNSGAAKRRRRAFTGPNRMDNLLKAHS
jgi:hypothetical protein